MKGKAYSEDFREAVIKHLEKGISKKEICKTFGIDAKTLYRWEKLKEEQGHLRRRPIHKPKYKKINPKELIKYVEENPDKTQKEIAEYFGVKAPSVWEALQKHKITRKKRQYATKKLMK